MSATLDSSFARLCHRGAATGDDQRLAGVARAAAGAGSGAESVGKWSKKPLKMSAGCGAGFFTGFLARPGAREARKRDFEGRRVRGGVFRTVWAADWDAGDFFRRSWARPGTRMRFLRGFRSGRVRGRLFYGLFGALAAGLRALREGFAGRIALRRLAGEAGRFPLRSAPCAAPVAGERCLPLFLHKPPRTNPSIETTHLPWLTIAYPTRTTH